jgi:hypothetical protein
MKKLGVVFISVLVIGLCIFIAFIFWQGDSNASEQNVEVMHLLKKATKDIILNNQYFYSLNHLGELYVREKAYKGYTQITIIGGYGKGYIRENITDKLIYKFPTTNLAWSDKYKSFLYYENGVVLSYNPSKNNTKKVYEVTWEHKESSTNYIFDVIDQYLFLNIDKNSYKIDLETSEVLLLTEYIATTTAKSNDMLIYKKDKGNDIMYLNLSTNKIYKINDKNFYNHDNSSIDIKSACIVDDILYFTKSDGQIYGVQISNGKAKSIEVFPKSSDISKKKVIGIEYIGESFVCVALDFDSNNGAKNLSVLEVYTDGTYDVIRKDDEIYNNTLDVPCKIKVQGQRYAYLVSTDDLVVFGWIMDRE